VQNAYFLTAVGLVSSCMALSACTVDEPNPIPPPGGSTPVQKLSELNIFEPPLAALQPVPGIVAYDVNVSLYADGAEKHRFVYVPPGTKIQAEADRFVVPIGAYLIKNFYYPNDARDLSQGIRIVETRFLVKRSNGFDVSTYVWNDDQTDAVVSGGNVNVSTRFIDQSGVLHHDYFHVPGTSTCQTCHQERALGLRTRQLDHPDTYDDGTTDQIDHLIAAGVLDSAPPSGIVLTDPFGDGDLDSRARSYLDANCAHCHAQGGEAYGTHVLWDYENTDADHRPTCKPVHAVAGNDRVIVPGKPDQSEFLSRMLAADPCARMPQGPTHHPDGAAVAVLSQWVERMSPAGCPP
jgi:uncharacterized repeat protein (TIGR03806 family)